MRMLRLALAQMNPMMGDLEGNSRRMCALAGQARNQGAELVVFPELALTGYPPEDLLLKPHFLADCSQSMKQLAKQFEPGITGVVGFAQGQGHRIYNAAGLIDQQQMLAVYHKIELPNYGVFDEKRYFTPGAQPLIFSQAGVRIALTICEDIWVQAGPVEEYLSQEHVDLVLNISASPFHAGKVDLREHILAKFAQRTQAMVVYVNLVGGQDELVFDGGSLVMDHQGKIIFRARHFEEDLLLVDLEFSENPPAHHSTAPVLELPPRLPIHPSGPKLSPAQPQRMDRIEEIYAALVLGTRDYVRKNHFQKVVLGLSGGIDSALTAVIAVDALGSEHVAGISMPSPFSSVETQADAQHVAENLKLAFYTVPITTMVQAFQVGLQPVLGAEHAMGLADENLQARIRGNLLMYFSNQFNWLVLTTGNKSENAVGYCTLYGDMAGGFAVIKDVPKMLVYELAAYVNRKAGWALIPTTVLERVPTAELRPNQKDEDSLPAYPILDPILKAYVEEDKSVEEIVARGFDRGTVLKVAQLVDRSEYKRRQAPPGVKITPKAFGRDRRFPITNQYPTDRNLRRPV